MSRYFSPRLLIVDADAAVRRKTAAFASSLGFETFEADTGRAALARFADVQPGIILLDPKLSDTSGYSLFSQCKAAAPHVQIAIATADRGFESVLRAMRMGAFDYLVKPFDGAQLRAMLDRMQQALLSTDLGSSQAHLAPPSAAAVGPTRLSEIERTTIERVFHQVNGDKAMAGKLLGISRATLYRKLKRYHIAPRTGLPQEHANV